MLKWNKAGINYVSACGRFMAVRFIRRDREEWELRDNLTKTQHVPFKGLLREAKSAAEWRLTNVKEVARG